MARPKGSRNKTTYPYVSEEKIAKCAEELESLQTKVKEKKFELKQLKVAKEKYDKQKILDIIVSSGMSTEEVMKRLAADDTEGTDESALQENETDSTTIESDIIQ